MKMPWAAREAACSLSCSRVRGHSGIITTIKGACQTPADSKVVNDTLGEFLLEFPPKR
jgi:hypothetical protein